MKKVLVMSLVVLGLLMTGCSPKKVTKEFTYSEIEAGLKYEINATINATNDYLDTVTEEGVYTFDDVDTYAEEIEILKTEFENYRNCPEGVGGVNCSKYIEFTWSMEGNVLTAKTVTHYDQARENKEGLTPTEVYSSKEYYSLKVTVEEYLKEGYEEK